MRETTRRHAGIWWLVERTERVALVRIEGGAQALQAAAMRADRLSRTSTSQEEVSLSASRPSGKRRRSTQADNMSGEAHSLFGCRQTEGKKEGQDAGRKTEA